MRRLVFFGSSIHVALVHKKYLFYISCVHINCSWNHSSVRNDMSVTSFQKTIGCKKESYSLTWILEHFDYIPFIPDHPVFGPIIRMGSNKWQIFMSKSLRDDDGPKSIGFRLVRLHDGNDWDFCEFTVHLQSKDSNTKIQCIEGLRVGGDEDDPYVYCQTKEDLIKKAEQTKTDIPDSPCRIHDNVLSLEERKAFMPSQAELEAILDSQDLVILIDITRIYLEDTPKVSSEPTPYQLVASDLKALLKSQKFADVEIETQGRSFRAHKNILSARAYVFEELLQDTDDPVKKFELDMPSDLAEAMLLYIYTGDLTEFSEAEDYESLYDFAGKYGVHNLKEECQKLLKNKFMIDIVCDSCQQKNASNTDEDKPDYVEEQPADLITVQDVKVSDCVEANDTEANKNELEVKLEPTDKSM